MKVNWLFPKTALRTIADSMRNGATRELEAVVLVGFSGTDSFKLTFNGNESALITRGTNYTAAGIKAAIEGITGFGDTVTVSDVTDSAFLVEWNTPGAVASVLSVTTATGVTGEVGVLVAGSDADPDDTFSLKGATMRLYTAPDSVNADVVIGDLTEATFDGYAVSAGVEWDTPYVDTLGNTVFVGTVTQWTATGGSVSETVRLVALVKSGVLLAIGVFDTPVPISAAGQVVLVFPQVTLPPIAWPSAA